MTNSISQTNCITYMHQNGCGNGDPILLVDVLDGFCKPFQKIYINDIAFLATTLDSSGVQIIQELQNTSFSGYYVKDFNAGLDVKASCSLPYWFGSVSNPAVTFTITDPNNCITRFDISGSLTSQTSSGTLTKTVILTNPLDFASMNMDIIFNSTTSPTVFKLVITFTGTINSIQYVFGANTSIFYVPVNQNVNIFTNTGNNKNNLIIHNGCKLSFDTGTGMAITQDHDYNIFKNLATGISNKYDINLVRDEFIPDGICGCNSNSNLHQFVYDDLQITATSLSYFDQRPKVFFSFAKASGIINPVTACVGVDWAFSTLSYSFIQLNSFVGYIDISYKTTKNSILSTTNNVLRLLVLPRPTLTVNAYNPSNDLSSNTPTNINYTLKNVQVGINGVIDFILPNSYIGLNNNCIPDISFNFRINKYINLYLTLTPGSLTIDPFASLFDICQNSLDTIPYGSSHIQSGQFLFKGLTTTINKTLFETVTAKYNQYGITAKQTATSQFNINITVCSNNNNCFNSLYLNSLVSTNSYKVNNIFFIKYVTINAPTSSYALDTDNVTIWLFVQNIPGPGAVPTAITLGGQPFLDGYDVPIKVPVGSRYAFVRINSSQWSFFGLI